MQIANESRRHKNAQTLGAAVRGTRIRGGGAPLTDFPNGQSNGLIASSSLIGCQYQVVWFFGFFEMAAEDIELNDVSLDEAEPSPAAPPTEEKRPAKEVPDGPSIYFDNSIDLYEEICDAESGETVLILFGFLTTMNDEGDAKLEDMCAAMTKAGVFYHSYNAKSGSKDYRMTRIGATTSRLEKFADKIDFVKGLDRDKIKKACEAIGLNLKNPDYAKSWYDPYAHLSGGFEIQKKELYTPFTDGDYIKLLFLILVGSPNFKDDAKGCGFDIAKLNSNEDSDAFCLGFFPLHEHEAKRQLSQRWLPLDWPSNMPIYDIKV